MGLLAAIMRRQARGAGEHVRPSLIDSAFTLMNHQLLRMLATGQPPEKLGSGAPSAAPYGVYAARDEELIIATANEPQFPRLCAALDLGGLSDDPRFRKMPDRLRNRAALDQLIAERIAQGDVEHWLAMLTKARISAGRVNNLRVALALPVFEERGL